MLLFCPITVIVGLALRDKAFAAPSLTTAEAVFNVKNWGPVGCTPIRWKEKWLKKPIFRHCDASGTSPDKPQPYYMLRADMERETLESGFEEALGPRAIRRWTANEVNGTFYLSTLAARYTLIPSDRQCA